MASASVITGRMVVSRRASIDLPSPGGLTAFPVNLLLMRGHRGEARS